MSDVTFSDSVSPQALNCPGCGECFLHQTDVNVYDRVQDAFTGQHVKIQGDGLVKIDCNLTGNPSGRRQGLTIAFTCEHCSTAPVLGISQHKGFTMIGWL